MEEYLAARAWYEDASPTLGFEFEDAVGDGIADTLLDPDRPVRDGAFHLMHLLRFPYTLVYRVLGDVVWIMAVAHQKRRRGYWRTRSVGGQGHA